MSVSVWNSAQTGVHASTTSTFSMFSTVGPQLEMNRIKMKSIKKTRKGYAVDSGLCGTFEVTHEIFRRSLLFFFAAVLVVRSPLWDSSSCRI